MISNFGGNDIAELRFFLCAEFCRTRYVHTAYGLITCVNNMSTVPLPSYNIYGKGSKRGGMDGKVWVHVAVTLTPQTRPHHRQVLPTGNCFPGFVGNV